MYYRRLLTGLLAVVAAFISSCNGHKESESDKFPMHFEVNGTVREIELNAESHSLKIPVSSDLNWKSSPIDVSWAKLSAEESEYSSKTLLHDGNVILDISSNGGKEKRDFTLTIRAGRLTIDTKIIQGTVSEMLSADAVRLRKTAPFTVEVDCSGRWSLGTTDTWYSIEPSSGEGPGSFKITAVDDNSMNIGERTGMISADLSGLKTSLSVSQSQTDNLIVKEEAVDIGMEGGDVTVHTLSNADYEVSIESGVDWIEHLPSSKALDAFEESFSVAENPLPVRRSATISFSLGSIREEVVINQDCPDPVLFVTEEGAYGINGMNYRVTPGICQASLLSGDKGDIYRILNPFECSVFEISGLRPGAGTGEEYDIDIVYTVGEDCLIRKSYHVAVIEDDGEFLRLKSSPETYFIIRK